MLFPAQVGWQLGQDACLYPQTKVQLEKQPATENMFQRGGGVSKFVCKVIPNTKFASSECLVKPNYIMMKFIEMYRDELL